MLLALGQISSTIAQASSENLSSENVSISTEQKVLCTATLEDDFADNRILIVLNNATSLSLKNYSVSDFPEISCSGVKNLTQAATDLVTAELTGTNVSDQ